MNMIPMKPKSHIEAIHYDPDTKIMHVRFRSGGLYKSTCEIPASAAADFFAAESSGKYWHSHIRPHFTFERVEEESK